MIYKLSGLTKTKVQNIEYFYGGKTLKFKFNYSWISLCWIVNIEYGDFVLNGLRLSTGYNVLNQYRNLLKWGLWVKSIDGNDPYYIDDFSTGNIELYLLDEESLNYTTNYLLRNGAGYW